MQMSMESHKNIESSIKNLETRVDQLANQLLGLPSNIFSANTKNNLKDHCSFVLVDERIIIKTKEEGT